MEILLEVARNYLGFLASSSTAEWFLAVVIAAIVYGTLLTYLIGTRHMTLASALMSVFGVCVDSRCEGRFRVPGGVGSFSLGLVPWLLLQSQEMSWLAVLARVQFIMGVVDILILYAQLLSQAWQGGKIVLLWSHLLGCGRLSAMDPVGGTLYILQIVLVDVCKIENAKLPLQLMRDFVALPYTFVGFVPAFFVCLPALLTGKLVIPLPVPLPPNAPAH